MTHALPDSGVDLRSIQRRTLGVLSLAQIVSGVGVAVAVALSSLYVANLSGSTAISGLAGTATVLGTALMALPTAKVAGRSGRRAGLTVAYGVAVLGCLLAILSVGVGSWPLLLVALALTGGASAGNLSARYTATDLAPHGHAARHLSLVVWSATIGSVAGPNLAEPAAALGAQLGLSRDAGPFALAALTFATATIIINLGLRPDPLLVARATNVAGRPEARSEGGTMREAWQVVWGLSGARRALVGIAVSHAVMVSVMSMTPVHLDHGGVGFSAIGVVISLHIAGMYVLSPVVGWAADRVGRGTVMAAGMALLFASAVLAGTAGHDVPRMAAGLAVLGLGWSCGLVAGSALLTESVPLESRPAVQGLSDLVMNVCGAAGALLAGVLVGATSFPAFTVVVAVTVAVTALPLVRRPATG
ncbi:MFS transporter [Acrocarpospora catenulata]|uniref:MFS transporter n=1 Tax=Acrocarpospora catenulata TaxID=2836182 RepID=UPI001BDA7424|nr:MFS transporter [Acrocarpospora catenulata]